MANLSWTKRIAFAALGMAAALTLAVACNPQASESPTQPTASGETADIVFINGTVYTVDESNPEAEAVAVKGNKIAYVGDAAGVEAYRGDSTEIIDLDGKMVLPGFVSGHDHLIASRWMNYGVDLYDAQSKEEYLATIQEYVDTHPDEEVIRGIGWNPDIYGGNPTAEELDAIVSDRPAILLEFTIHDAWLNTQALEVGQVTKDTPDPVPGVTFWVRDEAGNPTGTGKEFVWLPVYVASGAWQPDVMIPESQQELQQAAVEAGLTTFLNPGLVTPNLNNVEGSLEDFESIMDYMSELDERGELKLRAFVEPIVKNPSLDPEQFAETVAGFAEKYNSDRLRASGIKIHPEGNWSSRTSLMLEPYQPEDEDIDLLERPSPTAYGAASVGGDLMKAVVLAANAKGLDVGTHADGSATVRNMIDAIEASREAGYTDARNLLHHLFWTHPADLPRILEMDIPVNVTPNFSTDWSGQRELALRNLGAERVQDQLTMYPIIFENGNKVSLSADIPSAPIEHIGPLFQMQAAMTIRDPSNPNSQVFPEGREGITLEQAIKGVTIFPAWQIRMEDKIGSLEVGKYADVVILDRNLFDVDPDDIASVKVLATMMDGEFTYRAEDTVSRSSELERDRQLASANFFRRFYHGDHEEASAT